MAVTLACDQLGSDVDALKAKAIANAAKVKVLNTEL